MNALITGATKGIGRAIAFKLAEAGYNLAICARNADELTELCSLLQEKYPEVEIYARATDCANAQELKLFAEGAQQHFSHIGTLINNVGLYVHGNLLDEADGTLQTQMQLNVYTTHYLSKFFGRYMRTSGAGHIVNICSVAGIQPMAAAGAYSVTKYALMGLTNVLREELKPAGVKVTAIIPGSTLTHSWEGTPIAAEHFIQPEDIAASVLTCLKMSAGANIDEIVIRPVSNVFNT
ncbi:MAG: SDR family oxidoreductase [Sphingobacteriaceae bacterium]